MVLCGAGTSEFIGDCCEGPLRRRFTRDVDCRATTDIITNAGDIFLPGREYLVVSLARSGNSPESMGTWRITETLPDCRRLVITCNREGNLARAAEADRNAVALILPEETNDKSLVMTSSFTNMILAVLALPRLEDLDRYGSEVAAAAEAGSSVLAQADAIAEFAGRDWERGIFLGSGPLMGTAREAHLKMLESTDGLVMTRFDSFLGLRHGPRACIDGKSFVMAMLSGDPLVRRYEMDLLGEIKGQGKVGGILAVARNADSELESMADTVITLESRENSPINEELRTATDIVVGQLLALFTSMSKGLRPDTPSSDGTISRVVRGVKIYDPEIYRNSGEYRIIAG